MIDLTPGMRVAVIEAYGRSGAVTFDVVKTIGKRDIVLESGDRFRVRVRVRDQQRRVGGTWGTEHRLAATDDPDVTDRQRRRQARRIAARIADLARGIAGGGSTEPARDATNIATRAAQLTALTAPAAGPGQHTPATAGNGGT